MENVVRGNLRVLHAGALGEDLTQCVTCFITCLRLFRRLMMPFCNTVTIFGSLWILVTVGVYKYLPHHIMEMRERAAYYLLGKKSIAL
jgi:hypothetical protein